VRLRLLGIGLGLELGQAGQRHGWHDKSSRNYDIAFHHHPKQLVMRLNEPNSKSSISLGSWHVTIEVMILKASEGHSNARTSAGAWPARQQPRVQHALGQPEKTAHGPRKADNAEHRSALRHESFPVSERGVHW
jgi:hypothetical protein